MALLTTRERDLLNGYQRDFPLEPRPFRRVADDLGGDEAEVLGLVRGFLKRNLISRLGAVVRPNTAGASTLAAMAVPTDRLEEVAAIVSAEDCVNHNYEREHEIN
ncbi:MAG: Lrp/AsnC family transcriptional regulator, partial [Hyphomicrobiales bacterium]